MLPGGGLALVASREGRRGANVLWVLTGRWDAARVYNRTALLKFPSFSGIK